jgi:hypothetical protein
VPQGVDVARDEEDGVGAGELVPRERVVVAAGAELLADGRDRPLAGVVDVRERPPLRPPGAARVDPDALRLERLARAAAELVPRAR